MIDSFEIIEFLPYENPSTDIKVKYPYHWEKFEHNNGNFIDVSSPSEGFSDSYRENLFINVTSSVKNLKNELDDIVKQERDSIRQRDNKVIFNDTKYLLLILL
jgi:hypothetical protein